LDLALYSCFFSHAFLFKASSFSVTFKARFSASASSGFQSLFLTACVSRSVSAGENHQTEVTVALGTVFSPSICIENNMVFGDSAV